MYRLSSYLKVIPCRDIPGHAYLYSTRKSSLIRVADEILGLIERQQLAPEDETTLRRLGMIVEDTDGEKQAMLNFAGNLNARSQCLNILAVLNLNCNLACVYCYERGLKGKHYMSEVTAGKILEFAAERLTPAKKLLRFDFYGGEPLLSLKLIQWISQRANELALSRGCAYEFTLVSNGTLLTRKVAEELAALGLKSAKITLDGPPQNHDRFRPYRSGKGSFDIILSNIKAISDLVQVQIGGNFTRDNYSLFPLLLDHLEKEGITPDKLSLIKFDPVINPAREGVPADFKAGCLSINEPWLVEAGLFLREEILRRGFTCPGVKPTLCMIEVADEFAINYDGLIFKCPGFIGQKELAVGNVWAGLGDYHLSHHIGFWQEQACADCAYLPLCFGGCRYLAALRDGQMGRLDCRKSFLDNVLEPMVMQDFKYRR